MSTMSDVIQWQTGTFLQDVERRSGTPVGACFQCHKCSTGCPVAPETDFLSSQVMRLIQLGQQSSLLQSRGIWLCASCEACTTRCPMGIDVARVMDTLRMMAVEAKSELGSTRGEQFNRSFLQSVRRHGRVFELGMLVAYKIRSRDFLSDAEKSASMLAKGKLSLLPKRSGGAREMAGLFRRAEEEEKTR